MFKQDTRRLYPSLAQMRARQWAERITLFLMGAGAVAVLCWALQAEAHHADAKYSVEIRRAVSLNWPKCGDACHYTWWEAQIIQESARKQFAVSPVGARGLAQFMPATWSDMLKRGWAPRGSTPFEVRPALNAGARYMAHLRGQWRSNPRTELDRMALARASYNAGLGHLVKSQTLCGGVLAYDDIIACLPQVTGEHSRETIGYEASIRRIRRGL